jgi:hypothetical protein
MVCKRKCKILALSDKNKLIEKVEGNIRRRKDIAADFMMPANTL